jgi:hypothetical protein
MADAKISALPSATTPVGTEVLPLVQSGVTTKISINAATGITRPFTANGVVYASSTTAQATGSALVFDGSLFAVGTSTPATFAKQTIQYDGGGTVSQALVCIGYGGTPAITSKAASGTAASPGASNSALMSLLSQSTNDGTTFFNTAQILSGMESIASAGSHPTYILFSTTPSGSTSRSERVRITSSGNVGIGISSPSQKLTVATGSVKVSKAYSYIWDDANVEIRVDDSPAWLAVANTMTFKTYSGAFVFQNSNGAASIMTVRTDNSNVGIGTTAPDASAILDAQSTTKGVRMPNMTTTQKNAIASPAAGLMVFDTTLAKLCVYSGAAWQTITSV